MNSLILKNETAERVAAFVQQLLRGELMDRRVAVYPALVNDDALDDLSRCVVSAATLLDVGAGELLQNQVYAIGDAPLTNDELVAIADAKLVVTAVYADAVGVELVYVDGDEADARLTVHVRSADEARLLTFRWLFGAGTVK